MVEDQQERRDEIIGGIVDGSKTIESIEELKSVLESAPDNPILYRTVADILAEKDLYGYATATYRKAIRLFANSGMIVQAIAAQVFEWNIIKAADRECRVIYASLRDMKVEDVPVYDFFARMTYAELVAVLEECEPVRFPAGTIMKELGTEETDLYLIVSGTLRESIKRPMEGMEGENTVAVENLTENKFFGDIYPFEEEKVSSSIIESMTAVEVIKISKSDLVRVCRKFPNVEFLLMELFRTRSGSEGKRSLQAARATIRYQLQTKVTLKIFPDEPGQSPLVLNGFTEDISLGGTCVRLGETYWAGVSTEMVGKTVKLFISIPKASTGLDILGTLAWRREVTHEGKKTVLIGVQFRELTEEDFEFLKKHCYVGEGEQDMIYSLWESFVKK